MAKHELERWNAIRLKLKKETEKANRKKGKVVIQKKNKTATNQRMLLKAVHEKAWLRG